jgi:fructose-1-phosphate kinase PfkB-like protein
MSSVNTNESFDSEGKLDVLSLQELEYVNGGKKKEKPGGGAGNSTASVACNGDLNSTVSYKCGGGKAAMFMDLSAL